MPMDNKGTNPFADLLLIARLWRLFRREAPDCILSYTPKPNIYAGIAARMLAIPVVANRLVFTSQPTTTTAGVVMGPVEVALRDGQGNTITSFTGTVVVALTGNASGVRLGGSTNANAVAGVAKFSDLSVTTAGSGYRLAASADGAAEGTSTSFGINPASPDHAVFITQPSNTPANRPITPAVQIAVHDHYGNVATSYTGIVYMNIGNNGSPLGNGQLEPGGTQRSAAAGIATFEDLRINQVGVGYTLVASPGTLKDGTSAPFNVTP